jgi:hypothetical protein
MENKKLPFLLPSRCAVFFMLFVIGSAVTGKSLDAISYWWSVAASAVNLLIIPLLVLISQKQGGNYWKLINYEKGKTTPKQVIAMVLLIVVLGMGGMFLAGFLCYGVIPYAAPMLIAPIPLWLAIINIPLLPISTAFAENGLYLGCGVNQIQNKYAAILLPAFFFALQHSFIPLLPDGRYILYRFLSFLPLTLLLCWHYRRHRNPLPIMIGHAVIDLATVMQILATSAVPGLYEQMCAMQ